jgi:curved DNA-binding protein CbpA
MDANKDYYATLGLTPSADAVVIRAAYKALAQRYHPDKAGVYQEKASARMADINEAYVVLSDPVKRSEYDSLLKTSTRNADTAFSDGDTEPTGISPLDADWQTAMQFYPGLDGLREHLTKISWKLGEVFRARILDTKEFKSAKAIAAKLETEFLSRYFGSDAKVIEFARALVLSGNREAARDLNRAVVVLGPAAAPESVIHVICKKYQISKSSSAWGTDARGKRLGITARRYARDRGLDPENIIIRIQHGDMQGFVTDGVYYVETDGDGNPLTADPSAVSLRDSPGGWALLAIIAGVLALFLILASAFQ